MKKLLVLLLLVSGCASGPQGPLPKEQEEYAEDSIRRMQDEFNQVTSNAN